MQATEQVGLVNVGATYTEVNSQGTEWILGADYPFNSLGSSSAVVNGNLMVFGGQYAFSCFMLKTTGCQGEASDPNCSMEWVGIGTLRNGTFRDKILRKIFFELRCLAALLVFGDFSLQLARDVKQAPTKVR